MTWQAPTLLELTLLALAAFRLWKLLADDAITARLRYRLLGIRDEDDLPDLDDPYLDGRERRQAYLATLVRCPWCSGFYISIALWLLWAWQPHWSLVGATPLALSALVGLVATNLDPV